MRVLDPPGTSLPVLKEIEGPLCKTCRMDALLWRRQINAQLTIVLVHLYCDWVFVMSRVSEEIQLAI